ncbi:hypothetical protein LY78DRAFT_663178 [Colletotrichum sublineola]|nr:hypothetical protein LY78DRAFT_663178 [Colletotrichum sublineola]
MDAKEPPPAPCRLGSPAPRRTFRVIGTGSRPYGHLPRYRSLIVNSSRLAPRPSRTSSQYSFFALFRQ